MDDLVSREENRTLPSGEQNVATPENRFNVVWRASTGLSLLAYCYGGMKASNRPTISTGGVLYSGGSLKSWS